MANREQMIEREKHSSPLSNREIEEADDRSSTSAKVVHEAIRMEGMEELNRPSLSIMWSGLAAGLTMGCSMVADGLLRAGLPDAPWTSFLAAFGYSSGFVFVTMARQQLFTETTLTVMLPVLHKTHGPSDVMRYWSIVVLSNVPWHFAVRRRVHDPRIVPERGGSPVRAARRNSGGARLPRSPR